MAAGLREEMRFALDLFRGLPQEVRQTALRGGWATAPYGKRRLTNSGRYLRQSGQLWFPSVS